MKRILALVLGLALLCGCAPREQPQEAPMSDPVSPSVDGAPEELTKLTEPVEPEEPVPPVYADWSKLEDTENWEELCEWYWPEPASTLIPDDGYGLLLPYAGMELSMVDSYGWDNYRYGLVTSEGKVAVEPVYDSVSQLYRYREGWRSEPLPVYVLARSERLGNGEGIQLRGVAAMDGSWSTELIYDAVFAVGDTRLLLVDPDGYGWFCDLQGNVTASGLDRSVFEFWGTWWREIGGISSSTACLNAADGNGSWLIDFESGMQRHLPDVQYCRMWLAGDDLTPATHTNQLTGYLDREGNWVIAPQFTDADVFYGSYALATRGEYNDRVLIDRKGNTVLEPEGRLEAIFIDGSFYYLDIGDDDTIYGVYNMQAEAISHPAVGHTRLESWSALCWQDAGGAQWVWDGRESWQVDLNGAVLQGVYGSLLLLWQEDPETFESKSGVYDVEQSRWIIPMQSAGCNILEDSVTGEFYVLCGYQNCTVYNAEGEKLFSAVQVGTPADGCFTVQTGIWTGLLDRNGQWIMRRHMQTSGD